MSEGPKQKIGTVSWTDLTVEDAGKIRDFYSDVVGWSSVPVDMGGYSDFNMTAPGSDDPVAGICHRRGANADLPSQWMVYIVVGDLERSASRCEELGGKVLVPPKGMGSYGS